MAKCLKLVQVQVFFRHGSRTPLHHVRSSSCKEAFWTSDLTQDLPHTLYPFKLIDICSNELVEISTIFNIPLAFKLPGGSYTGELIRQGQQEAFDLGRRLRRDYVERTGFITLDHSDIYCRSTYILRTIISLRCLAAGLFGGDSLSTDHAVPLPIYVEKIEREILFPNPCIFPALEQLSQEGAEESSNSKGHQDLKQKLRVILGVDTLLDDLRPSRRDCPIYYVRDDYMSRKSAGFPIPVGLEQLLPMMHQLAAEELYWEYLGKRKMWDKNISDVFGRVFRMILSTMLKFADVPKFHLYSCHDSTLMLLLYGLGCFDGQWPPFSADVLFELYVDESAPASTSVQNESSQQNTSPLSLNDLWIRVLYMGKPVPLGCVWQIPYENGDRYNEGYVPLHFLFERWKSDAPKFEPKL